MILQSWFILSFNVYFLHLCLCHEAELKHGDVEKQKSMGLKC